jgi:alkylated DNA repair dioxygenase AlkB
MSDLFDEELRLERLPLANAEVHYLRRLPLSSGDGTVLAELIRDTPWRQEQVKIWGKSHPQPRLVAWYGDEGKSYTYSGISLSPLPWTPLLMDVRRSVEAVTAARFNSVLLNYYRDHRDSMGFHSDDERELGPTPLIASVSVGEPRTFVFKAKDGSERDYKVVLDSGSLLVMRGGTQANWKHGIPKESRPCGPRVNLTFRQILP